MKDQWIVQYRTKDGGNEWIESAYNRIGHTDFERAFQNLVAAVKAHSAAASLSRHPFDNHEYYEHRLFNQTTGQIIPGEFVE
jgi:hypothetical protein